jgi:hypothetical protein
MSEQKNGVGAVVIGVVAVGLVALVGVDQMRQHAKPAPPKPVGRAGDPLVPTTACPFIEGDSVGRRRCGGAAGPADTSERWISRRRVKSSRSRIDLEALG